MNRRTYLATLGTGLAATLAGCSSLASTPSFELGDDCDPTADTELWGQRSGSRTGASAVDRSLPVESTVTVDALASSTNDPLATASAAPVLAGGYVVTPTLNGLVALDRETGEREWTFSLPEDEGVATTPVVTCGIVIAATSYNDTYAVDLETGEQVGTIPVTATPRPEGSPVVSGSTLLVPGDGVTAYDLEAGETLWSEDPGDSDIGVCTDGSFAYVTYRTEAEAGILSLDLQSGDTEWALDDPAAFDTLPALADGLLYAVTDRQELVCVSAADGAVEWRRPVSGNGHARPAVAGDQVAVDAGQSEQARVFDADTGDELTTVETGVSYSQPVFTEDALLVAGSDVGLLVLDRSSLTVSARHSSVGYLDSQLSVGTEEAFYVPAPGGGLYRVAFRAP